MTAATLASYAVTGRREIWPLLVVFGVLLVVVTGVLVAQWTDPDRKRRAVERRDLIARIAAADPAPDSADVPAAPPEPVVEQEPDERAADTEARRND